MSIPVDVAALREQLEQFGVTPYLVTVGSDGRPHAVAVAVEWRDDALVAAGGSRTRANAEARPDVCLLWPPFETDGYSLIADADARVVDGAVVLRPTKAVLHRPAAGQSARAPSDDAFSEGTSSEACGADCVPVTSSD